MVRIVQNALSAEKNYIIVLVVAVVEEFFVENRKKCRFCKVSCVHLLVWKKKFFLHRFPQALVRVGFSTLCVQNLL